MKNYYGLVASRPDVSPDDAKLNFTVADFKEDYWPQLSETDKKLVRATYGRGFCVKRGPRPWRR